jgi:CTP synthase (UTP-ammonia lyase)
MSAPLKVGIIGDFERTRFSHWATEAALYHAAARLGRQLTPCWIGTDLVQSRGAEGCLAGLDGVWGAPGSPYLSAQGMLDAIRCARESGLPYLGTCAGFQYALIELSRNVLGLSDADSAENESGSAHVVITPVSCPLPARRDGGPQLSGTDVVLPAAGSLLAELCGRAPLQGEYNCNFEVNGAYLERWQAAGLRAAAYDALGALRAFELTERRFFLATLFQPQLSSRPDAPHPLVVGFLRACMSSATL